MKEYSFLDTIMLVNGVEIGGFGELADDVIKLARRNDSASDVIGTDGEMTVSMSANLSGTVTFRLLQSSTSNTYMSGLVVAQENGSFTPIFVQFKDTRGGDLGSGTSGYITKPADMNRGEKPTDQEWVIVVERLDLLHLGG